MAMSSPSVPQRRLHLFWRVSLMFVAATLIYSGLFALANNLYGPTYSLQSHVLRAVLMTVLVLPTVWIVCRWVDQRPLISLGFSSSWTTAGRSLLLGMVAWLIPALLSIAFIVGVGWMDVTFQATPVVVAQAIAVRLLLVLLYEAFPEELIFRGYLYQNMATQLNRWQAVVIQALLFTLWAVLIGAAPSLGRVSLFLVVGLGLGYIRARTGQLWVCVGFHLAFQTVLQFVSFQGQVPLIVSISPMLNAVALGSIPFALGITLIDLWFTNRTHWRVSEEDVSPTLPA